MIEVYKIISGIERIRADKFFTLNTLKTRGHSKKFYKPFNRLDIRKNIFSQRVIDSWNKLPESLVSVDDLISV